MPKGRDDALKALLPPVDSPYNFHELNEAETKALEEALGDGFGERSALGSKPLPLPQNTRSGHKLESGLLKYSYFELDTSNDSGAEEYEDSEHPIWYTGPEGEPAPFEVFPLNFIPRRLQIYFDNQLDRFGKHVASFDPADLEWLAQRRLFEKPWYEFHAVQLLDWNERARVEGVDRKNVGIAILGNFSGELGRLVEQYYWRFRYEKAAITGVGARKGASLGGKLKSARDKARLSDWQRLASDIWSRNPNLSKLAVAGKIKKRLGETRTAKHIARYISKSTS
jgi:hypothetical protein